MNEGMHIVKKGFQLDRNLENRLLQDILEKMPKNATTSESAIRSRIRLILSNYGDRNVFYDKEGQAPPSIGRNAIKLPQKNYWVDYETLFLLQDNYSITMLKFLLAVVSENVEDQHPAGFEKTGISESDKMECYDRILDFIKRNIYSCQGLAMAQ